MNIATTEDLLAYLRTQFKDLVGAKDFMWRWVNEMNQLLPDGGVISCRSLAAHCSYLLEGSLDHSGSMNSYINSKHGVELYLAAWGDRP